ncbi:unnamed protein product [Linum trigynum]|uniref:Uncharacterized protein n=1 Tax=Linum trigynum TaxID=586398 RepID=A0AAV2EH74_9ROSI
MQSRRRSLRLENTKSMVNNGDSTPCSDPDERFPKQEYEVSGYVPRPLSFDDEGYPDDDSEYSGNKRQRV